MRPIDADALTKILTTAIRNMEGLAKFIGCEDDPEIKTEIRTYRDILNGVKEQPTIEPEREKGKWIPCSERLPIDAGHYLCSFEKPNRIDHIHVDLAYWTGGRWYGYRADAICAWMPLPEPYREESEKDG